jgi:CubicO group peptidase (beta-lactamase class C family)
MRRILILVGILLPLIGCVRQEITIDTAQKDEVLKVIEAERNNQQLNAVSFCVVKGDSVLWMDAMGPADRENNKKATTDTRFLIASISKAVTAVAAMECVRLNKLDLDADINTYLPFEVRNPKFPEQPITARMLLNHSSSISDAYYSTFDFYCWNTDCAVPLGIFLPDFFKPDRDFYSAENFYNYAPGTQANYSNMGYALLGYLVERISYEPFDQYCKSHIFLPLGMTKTEWRLADTPLDELAIPYSPTITSSTPHYTFPDYPNGGLRTTPADLSKFLRMLMNEGRFNGITMLNANLIALMQQRTISFMRGGLSFEYGLGLYYYDFKGQVLFGHGGGEQGTTTAMHYDPSSKVGVIIFTNSNSANLDLMVYSLYKYGTAQ